MLLPAAAWVARSATRRAWRLRGAAGL